MFYVGQEVECIDDNWDPLRLWRGAYPQLPKLHGKYVIEAIDKQPGPGALKDCDHLILVEISVGCFACDHFRPIQKKKTDITIFTEMLKDKEVEIA